MEWHKCDLPKAPDEVSRLKQVIIGPLQVEAFAKEFKSELEFESNKQTDCAK